MVQWFLVGVVLFFAGVLGHPLFRRPLLATLEDDSDMKIVGENIFQHSGQEEKENQMGEEVGFQRLNGNLDKAQELGRRMAFDVCHFGKYEGQTDPNICDQMRMLFAFTQDYAINNLLLNEYVCNTASSSYFKTLQDTDEWFYDHLQTTGVFSVYLLQVRRYAGDEAEDIGREFSKFCLHEGESEWDTWGQKLFEKWYQESADRIVSYDFQ